MNGDEDLLKNLRQILNEQGIESFHVLEELVPIEEQMEYFRHFEKLRRDNDSFERDEEIVILFSSNQPIDRKKKSLVRLASIPDVGAYRAIETYHSSPADPELSNWSALALLGSKIILSSNLSGQQQIYVSSGLGGHEKKLRFFSMFTTKERQPFSNLQKEIVEREFKFQLSQADVEIEKFEIEENYFTILMLFPIEQDPRVSINAAIEEINQYGDFLDTKFLFTNVKILSEEEIQKMLNRGVRKTDEESNKDI